MYEWVSHTWNTVKGNCEHDCSYCYMKKINHRFGKDIPAWFDEKELSVKLGKGKKIFVGSSNDLFANAISDEWIFKTIEHCLKYPENEYVFQTKNPQRLHNNRGLREKLFELKNVILGSTIESNRNYKEITKGCESPGNRARALNFLQNYMRIYITIEPIMDFDLKELKDMLKYINPFQINIGADSGNNNLPEPTKEKVMQLIEGLNEFTIIHNKSNLKRLLS